MFWPERRIQRAWHTRAEEGGDAGWYETESGVVPKSANQPDQLRVALYYMPDGGRTYVGQSRFASFHSSTAPSNQSSEFQATGTENRFYLEVGRATTVLSASAICPWPIRGRWTWIACRTKVGGVAGDQHLYFGNDQNIFQEPASYVAQNLGTGAQVTTMDRVGVMCRYTGGILGEMWGGLMLSAGFLGTDLGDDAKVQRVLEMIQNDPDCLLRWPATATTGRSQIELDYLYLPGEDGRKYPAAGMGLIDRSGNGYHLLSAGGATADIAMYGVLNQQGCPHPVQVFYPVTLDPFQELRPDATLLSTGWAVDDTTHHGAQADKSDGTGSLSGDPPSGAQPLKLSIEDGATPDLDVGKVEVRVRLKGVP